MKAIEINIKITIPAELVEKEGLTVKQAYDEFLNDLEDQLIHGVKFEGEAHEI